MWSFGFGWGIFGSRGPWGGGWIGGFLGRGGVRVGFGRLLGGWLELMWFILGCGGWELRRRWL